MEPTRDARQSDLPSPPRENLTGPSDGDGVCSLLGADWFTCICGTK